MSTKTGQGLADFAKSKVGIPYFYGAKMEILTEALMARMHKLYPKTVTSAYILKARMKKQVNKINCDCSGLIGAYRGKQIGSSQLYSTASKRMPIGEWKTFPIGTVLYKPGHVGVYVGGGLVAEEKGIDYGCILSKIGDTKWTYGLLFSDIDYKYKTEIVPVKKAPNPYAEPNTTIGKGIFHPDVKWIQWELIESGYGAPFEYNGKKYSGIVIDGDFGKITDAATRAFQQSCKIQVDGKVGPETRRYLKAR